MVEKRQDKIEQILLEFRGLKDITLCTTAKRRSHIVEMEDEHGHKHSDQDGIAEVFASFYEKLYTGRKTVKGPVTVRTQLKPFTREELTDALSKMSKEKVADDSGIVAEMLNHGNKALLDAILNLFNDIVVGGQGIPSKWKMTRLTVIFKKGNAKLPSNYRPIAITTNPLQTFQSYVLRAHSNYTHVTAIFRSSSVSCWIQHRRP